MSHVIFQSLWDRLFFWQSVPASLPLKASQFRLLNPEIIRETALDLLHYPGGRERLLDWDQVSCFSLLLQGKGFGFVCYYEEDI